MFDAGFLSPIPIALDLAPLYSLIMNLVVSFLDHGLSNS